MNHVAFLLFFVFFFAVLGTGIMVYRWLNPRNMWYLNKAVYLAEVLLLGASLIIGLMVLLSILGLYRGPFLWALVVLAYGSYLCPEVRSDAGSFFNVAQWDLFKALLIFFVAIFIFRNMYFLFDVDDIRNYLYSQKIWLLNGTSIIKCTGYSFVVFLPQFDDVPSALGLSVFPHETLFPELINIFWRVIVFLMLFGYGRYRFNGAVGLGAMLFTMFNDHIFYSGVNAPVIINAALVGLVFAASYNFWESRKQGHPFRFVLALVFASQLLPNKYQGAYLAVFIVAAGLFIQPDIQNFLRGFFSFRRGRAAIVIAGLLMLLWPLKNYLATGDPLFPAMAAKAHAFGWTQAELEAFKTGVGGLKPMTIFKYLNYLFIWPGIMPAKYVCMMLSFMPVILLFLLKRRDINREALEEFSFWMTMSVISLIALCLVAHSDPRYYRYAIAVFSMTAVCGLYFIFIECLNVRLPFVVSLLILMLAISRFSIIFWKDDEWKHPTVRDNMDVLLDRIHTQDVMKKNFPEVEKILAAIKSNPDKAKDSAYSDPFTLNFPTFLLPVKPLIGEFQTNVIRWDSYDHPDLIVRDLSQMNIKWVLVRNSDGDFVYISRTDFAKAPVLSVDHHPSKLFADYGFPAEITGKDR